MQGYYDIENLRCFVSLQHCSPSLRNVCGSRPFRKKHMDRTGNGFAIIWVFCQKYDFPDAQRQSLPPFSGNWRKESRQRSNWSRLHIRLRYITKSLTTKVPPRSSRHIQKVPPREILLSGAQNPYHVLHGKGNQGLPEPRP
jgi:hypothetical protein